MEEREVLAICDASIGCSDVIGEEGVCEFIFGDDPKAVVESFLLFPTLAAELTGAADDPMEGERRIRSLCGSSADASMVTQGGLNGI